MPYHANLTRSSPPALSCLKPVRVLWRRELEGQGLFAMNHRELSVAKDVARQQHEQQQQRAPNATETLVTGAELAARLREAQCARMLQKGYKPPPEGRGRGG